MEEIFDHLIIRFVFAITLCFLLYSYKYLHFLLYPSGKKQVLQLFNPLTNTADSIHYFGRLIGMGVIFLSYDIHFYDNLPQTIFYFSFWSTVDIGIYLLTMTILEGILFYKFDYQQEILKRKNITYATLSAFLSINAAFILKKAISLSEHSVPTLVTIWLLGLVLFALIAKQYSFFSIFNFSKQIYSRDNGVLFSFTAFITCISVLLTKAMETEAISLTNYLGNFLVKVLLCSIFMPIFYQVIKMIYLVKQKMTLVIYDHTVNGKELPLALGILEAMLFCLTSFMTYAVVFGINIYNHFQN